MSKKSKKSTERLIKELVRKQMYEDSISEEPEHRSIMPSKRTRSHIHNSAKDFWDDFDKSFDEDEKDMPHPFTARTLNVKTGESKSLWNAAKTYVLDTNILLQSPDSIFGFDDNEVVKDFSYRSAAF